MLGDLGISGVLKDSVAFKFEQSSIHGLYIMHLFSLFFDYCTGFPRIFERHDPRYDKTDYSIYFLTMALPCFMSVYNIYFVEGVKRIPLNIVEYLTDVVLAYWISDDGGKITDAGLILNTSGFSKPEVELLSAALNSKFGFSTVVYTKRSKGRSYWIIYIPKGNLPLLRSLVLPHLHSSMHYKVGA